MSDAWRICVVEGDVSLNQNLVNTLRKDGYVVQGVMNGADAMSILWIEEYDVVICDLKLPGADGFELLHWLRAYRSNVRMLVLGDASRTEDSDQRLQAFESGAIGYIEKPVDLRLLRDELRRLLQQTGFTASLDSFDLLDVIQIMTMSRKSITLLINTGLEERGMLRFQNGDLAWAEYGILRGEEAFFALAAHKNGTVTQQLSGGQSATNVTQPLSRLIFQALQYRTKYAHQQGQTPLVGTGLAPVYTPGSASSPVQFSENDIDDTPFFFGSEESEQSESSSIPQMPPIAHTAAPFSAPQELTSSMAQFESPVREQQKEWWEIAEQTTGKNSETSDTVAHSSFAVDLPGSRQTLNTSPASPLGEETNTQEQQPPRLPSWLTEQPTSTYAPIPPATHSSPKDTKTPIPPISPSLSGEMRPIQPTPSAQVPFRTTDDFPGSQQSASYKQTFASETQERQPSSPQWSQEPQRPLSSPQWSQESQRPSSPQWSQEPQRPPSSPQWSQEPQKQPSSPQWSQEIQRQPSSPLHKLTGQSGALERIEGKQNPPDALHESNPMQSSTPLQTQRQLTSKNYAAVVSALQTLGYSLPGFIAAAVLDSDTHLIAQVSMDDADNSQTWQILSVVQRSMLNALRADKWGMYEETIITTASRHILMRATDGDQKAFLLLITTREADLTDSLQIMRNVEGAIITALH